jgi:hypothetical protein
MNTNNELDLLKQLSDPFQDFIDDGDSVLLYRGGKSFELKLERNNLLGLIVYSSNTEIFQLPFFEFIEKKLIGLPLLAGQIVKKITESNKKKSIIPIDGPIDIDGKSYKIGMDKIIELIKNPPAFSTRVIQLMARAGQGKSVLLDMTARKLADSYTSYTGVRTPLLLNVDLLGRYVGTIEDAIAGALNNSYMFPLSQHDVIASIKNGWLVLALDGFDELVARVGAKDAFQKLADIIDQLEGRGTIIISARESFFELYQIQFASQSYFTPKNGSFEKTIAILKPWTKTECSKLIEETGKEKSKAISGNDIYDELNEYFKNDNELLSNPFFLSKFINIWLDDGNIKFSIKNAVDNLAGIQFVIDKYLERENEEKWKNRDGVSISTMDLHKTVLGTIAEELFRSSTQHLSLDELQLCTEIALSDNASTEQKEIFIEKISTHSVFDVVDKRYSFSHIQYSNYYLSLKIVERIKTDDIDELCTIYQDKEISLDIINWVRWLLTEDKKLNRRPIISKLKVLLNDAKTQILRHTLSIIIFLLLNGAKFDERIDIKKAMVMGEDLYQLNLYNINICNTEIIAIDLSSTSMENVLISKTNISAIKFGNKVSYKNVKIADDVKIESIITDEKGEVYAPVEINNIIKNYFEISNPQSKENNSRPVKPCYKEVVNKMIKTSNKTYYFSLDGVVNEGGGKYAKAIGKIGLKHNIFKEKHYDRSGTPVTIVSFAVDKQKLQKGSEYQIGEQNIDAFWEEVSQL